MVFLLDTVDLSIVFMVVSPRTGHELTGLVGDEMDGGPGAWKILPLLSWCFFKWLAIVGGLKIYGLWPAIVGRL